MVLSVRLVFTRNNDVGATLTIILRVTEYRVSSCFMYVVRKVVVRKVVRKVASLKTIFVLKYLQQTMSLLSFQILTLINCLQCLLEV